MISPIGVVAVKDDLSIGNRARQPVRAGANWVLVEVFAASIRHDPESAFAQVPEKRRVGLGSMKREGEIVAGFDAVDKLVGCAFDGDQGTIAHGVEGPFHVFGGQRTAIMKMNTVVKMKDIGLRVGSVPAFGHCGLELEM